MKCNLTHKETRTNHKFPKIMSNGEDFIVIMHNVDGDCTVLNVPPYMIGMSSQLKVGQIHKVCYHLFSDYNKEVTLTNQ